MHRTLITLGIVLSFCATESFSQAWANAIFQLQDPQAYYDLTVEPSSGATIAIFQNEAPTNAIETDGRGYLMTVGAGIAVASEATPWPEVNVWIYEKRGDSLTDTGMKAKCTNGFYVGTVTQPKTFDLANDQKMTLWVATPSLGSCQSIVGDQVLETYPQISDLDFSDGIVDSENAGPISVYIGTSLDSALLLLVIGDDLE